MNVTTPDLRSRGLEKQRKLKIFTTFTRTSLFSTSRNLFLCQGVIIYIWPASFEVEVHKQVKRINVNNSLARKSKFLPSIIQHLQLTNIIHLTSANIETRRYNKEEIQTSSLDLRGVSSFHILTYDFHHINLYLNSLQ